MVQNKVIKNSTLNSNLSDSSNKAMQLWNKGGSCSISSIEEIFDPVAIKEVVESLVMTRFGSHYSKLYLRANSRRSRRNSRWSQMSKQSSDISISTCGISGLISLQYRNEPDYVSPDCFYTADEANGSEELEVQSLTRSSPFDPSHREFVNLRLSMLQETKDQIVKAINYHELCSKSSRAMFRERLEAEKILLVTDIEASLLFVEDDKLSSDFCTGTVKLSKIQILPEEAYADHHFICVVTSGSKLFASKVCKTKSNGIVYFHDTFTVTPLLADFKLHVKLFSLSPKSLERKQFTILCGKSEDVFFRESLFRPWGEFDLQLRHLKNSKTLQVQLPLGSLKTSVLSSPNINVILSGFVNVCLHGCHSWDRQWCTLNGTYLKFYNEPSAEWYNTTPTATMDLTESAKVKVLTREECAKKNTVLLVTKELDVLLSWESSYKFQCWLKNLELVLLEINVWGHY